MTILEAKRIVKEDEDFDDEGQLKEDIVDLTAKEKTMTKSPTTSRMKTIISS
jgi:hypothetical protein